MELKRHHGFTLIELMVVLSILSILATMAIPSYQDHVIRTQVQEAFNLSELAEKEIQDFYKARGGFPADNAAVGLPEPEKIIGNFVTSVNIENGVIHITLGNRVNKHVEGKIITIRPAVVQGAPKVPIAWVRGYASVPNGMSVSGEDRTDVLPRHLPLSCRY